MRTNTRRWLAATGVAALLASVMGCSSENNATGNQDSAVSVDNGFKIGLLLPESKTTRYEAFDRPLMEAKLKQLCPKCEVVYQNADQDTAKQVSQAESMFTQGVKVLILDAVDAKAAEGMVSNAKGRKIPVIAYDRLASGPVDYYVSFDNRKVGEVQGQALLDGLTAGGDPKRGQIVMINGSPTDPNAADFKAGAHSILDGKVNIGKEYDTPDWSPDKAQQEMEQAITALGRDTIVGVLSANDGMASGAIAAMKRAGFPTLPPITGQDAELAAVQRILTGEQYMTIYLDIRAEAEKAAELAVALGKGGKPAAPTTVNNGTSAIPSVLLDPIAVTADKVKDTIVKDGFYKPSDICTGAVAAACAKAGIS